MYKDYFIDSIGEDKLRDILDGKTSYIFKIDNTNSKDQQLYYAFQHFLIKAFLNGYNRNACITYIKKMYGDFYKKPYLFCDSPLIKDKVLQLFFGDDLSQNEISKYRNNYYNYAVINDLYNKRKQRELTLEEKQRYFAYLIVQLKRKNKKYDELFKYEITRIINTDYQKLTDIELKFYSQYVSNYARGNSEIDTVVMIGTDSSSLRGYQSNGYVFINKKAFQSIELLTKTVCHETRHTIQWKESFNKITLAAFEMAQMSLFIKYLNTANYNSYHKNYRYSSIELDAELEGHWKAAVFFGMFKRRDLGEKVQNNRRVTYDKRNNYSFMIDENNKAQTVDDFIVTKMDEIIIKKPSELNNYPVLNIIYNADGTRKSFETIIQGRMDETVNNRGIFDNYINYGIAHDELNGISINHFSPNDLKIFTNVMARIYHGYIIELKDYFNDKTNSINPRQIIFAINSKLLLAYKLLQYINHNYDAIVSGIKEERFNNQHPIYNFIYDLRDFKISDIKNETVKGNQEIISHIMKVKSLSDSISKKFNYTYIDDRISGYPSEIRNGDIVTNNGSRINFEEYFKKDILSMMDSHLEVTINNKKYYVGDLIRAYAQNVRENLKDNIQTFEGKK